MKKSLLLTFFSFAAASTLMAQVNVTTSILPTKFFVEKIAGDDAKISTMVVDGANPHTYEPRPTQMKELEKSEIYFGVGGTEFDNVWVEKFKKQYPKIKFVDTASGIEKMKNHDHDEDHDEHEHDEHADHDHDKHEHGDHDHDKHDKHKDQGHHAKHHEHGDHHEHCHCHHHGEFDPHVWMDPILAKTQAQNILNALKEKYPADAAKFDENFAKLTKELDELDAYAKEKLGALNGGKFLIYHPALGYFAHRYNLEELSVEIEGKEPKPAELKELIDTAKKEKIKTIFIAKGFPTKAAQTIAKETGANVVKIDILSEQWDKSMREIIDEIAKSMK